MNGEEFLAISWVARLIALAVVLQTIEILMLRASIMDSGVWTWIVLKQEFTVFPAPLQQFFDHALKYSNFICLLYLQFIIAVSLIIFPTSIASFYLCGSVTLCCLRWRGTFNGGSDFMTLVVLPATSVALIFQGNPGIEKACLWYIAIQTCSSYFSAGLSKLRTENWRTGKALIGFLHSAIYQTRNPLDRLIRLPYIAFLASWMVILFECSFPIALISTDFCRFYIGASFAFHLANFYVFGLNRFLFAWMATYPALYYCSHR